jgi:transglutaminase-like putative cysteine protease
MTVISSLFMKSAANSRLVASTAAVGFALLSGCALTDVAQPDLEPVYQFRSGLVNDASFSRVTLDIKDGIVSHINEKATADEGVYRFSDGDEELELKLVRVHMAYLSQLGPTSHFACVDLATQEGDVYDVDFFLEGEPGRMVVSDATLHKRNGQPRYVWEQGDDDDWFRVDVDDAPPELLGVIKGQDSFEFTYQATVPEIKESGRMWLPLASGDKYQVIEDVSIEVPGAHQILIDKEHGNQVLFLELSPADSGERILIRYQVTRSQKGVYEGREGEATDHLRPELLVPATDDFEEIAEDVVEGELTDLGRARALYDHVLDNMRYAKIGSDYGHGDAQYACDSGTGNCTDYHSYFMALARSVGIPARFAIGVSIPSSRDKGGISGYHCWAEFYSGGYWWPVDISEADKNLALGTFYFGNHPANRLEFSRGRDLVLEPGPKSGPINFLAYPVTEVDGVDVRAKINFSFVRKAK